MENNNIDRLFQDKLSRYEIAPTKGAWEAVQAQMATKQKPVMWYAVAAAVAVLALVTVLITRSADTLPTGAMAQGKVDHPVPEAPVQWTIPSTIEEASVPVTKVQAVKTRRKASTRNEVALAQEEVTQQREETEVLNVADFNLPSETVAQVEQGISTENEEAIEALPGVSVQITYKSTPPVAAPQKSKIERLWAKARDLKPGEMLGSIRETKNDFFNGKKN